MILPDILILAKTSNKIDLIILEAVLIKQHKPIINVQTDDFNRTLTAELCGFGCWLILFIS